MSDHPNDGESRIDEDGPPCFSCRTTMERVEAGYRCPNDDCEVGTETHAEWGTDIRTDAQARAILESIVRALAAADPNVDLDSDYHVCAFCHAGVPVRPEHHEPTCVWRRAVEYVANHPTDGVPE